MDIREEVYKIVASVCETDVENIKGETTIGDFPGWDSMGQLSILQQVEETLNISFEPEEMMELEDVNDIIKAVEEKL
jgi:acyl carrier protein